MNLENLINQTEAQINDDLAFITQMQKLSITGAFRKLREEIPTTPEKISLDVVKMIYAQAQDNPKVIEGLFGSVVVSKCAEIINELKSKS